jgi:hypothetical protein
MFCPACRSIFENYGVAKEYREHPHHLNYKSLCSSADLGCEACVDLLSLLHLHTYDQTGLDELVETPCVVFSTRTTLGSSDEIQIYYDSAWLSAADANLENMSRLGVVYVTTKDACNADSYRESQEGSSSARLPRPRVEDRTDSQSSFMLIAAWLSQCQHYHSTCNSHLDPSWAPTRLIDVLPFEDTQKLRLCIMAAGHNESSWNIQYTTLSHRWDSDSSSQLKLTRGNLVHLCSDIELLSLPQTFVDAIQITRKLGIRYLWIDSLCIIQDDEDDWTHEAALMDRVYMNGLLNISAAGAEESSQGCFFRRDPSRVDLMPTTAPPGRQGSWRIARANFWMQGVEWASLNKRGWVLQERVLSRRVLHFAKEQVFWECRQLRASESLLWGIERGLCGVGILGDAHVKDLVPGQDLVDYGDQAKWMEFDFWQRIVEMYTSCDLTFRKDKLVALSGISRQFHALIGSDYAAGLWRDHLPHELLWNTTNGFRPEGYVAPSWSWASVEGAVKYPDGMYEVHKLLHHKGECLRILDVNITLASGKNPFGQVTGGSLLVRGKLGLATWTWPCIGRNWTEDADVFISNNLRPLQANYRLQHSKRFLLSSSEDEPTSIYLDDVTQKTGPVCQQAFFLPIYIQSSEWVRDLEGLLLLSVGEGRFTRIGKLTTMDERVDEILGCLVEREVTIF